jgi:hypothetical protein
MCSTLTANNTVSEKLLCNHWESPGDKKPITSALLWIISFLCAHSGWHSTGCLFYRLRKLQNVIKQLPLLSCGFWRPIIWYIRTHVSEQPAVSVCGVYVTCNEKQSLYGPGDFREVEAPRFQDRRHMKLVRLSALRTCRLCPPGNIPGTLLISVRGWVDTRAIVQPEGLCQRHLWESNPRPILLLVRRSFISVNDLTFVNEICLRASLPKQGTVFSSGLYTLWTPM